MDRYFRINTPKVVSEVIDGEVVIMNLASGHYFSTQGTGELVWREIERGEGTARIGAMLASLFDASAEALASGLDAFLTDMLGHGLIVETGAAAPAGEALPHPAPAAQRAPFAPPVLDIYTDMQDMLLLDPIDDVTEAGWPVAPPALAAGPARSGA